MYRSQARDVLAANLAGGPAGFDQAHLQVVVAKTMFLGRRSQASGVAFGTLQGALHMLADLVGAHVITEPLSTAARETAAHRDACSPS